MPITLFLRDDQAFDPVLVKAMSAAYDHATRDLGLVSRADPITELVAEKVIEATQRGARTETALYLTVMQAFTKIEANYSTRGH